MSGETQVKTKCYSCSEPMTVDRREIAQNGKQVYCQGCLIECECRVCGRSIQTTHDKFAQFDGKPVCKNCSNGPVNPNKVPDMESKGVLGRRVVAAVIDLIVPALVMVLVGAIIETTGIARALGPLWGDVAAQLLLVGAYLYNFVILEAESGQSVGKMVTGLMVAKKNGAECTYTAAIVRNILRPIDLLMSYGVGFLTILFSSDGQRIGDIAAGTVVVRVSK